MSDLIAIVYPSEQKAEEVRQRLLQLQKEYLIKISDAVIAVKTEAGPVKLNQLVNTTSGATTVTITNIVGSNLALVGATAGPVSIGAVTVKLFDQGLHCVPSEARTHNVSVPEPL